MKNMDEDTITRLIEEALATNSVQDIYNLALKHINVDALQNAQSVTQEELCVNFSVAGFIAGIWYILENLDIKDDEENCTEG